MRGRNRDLNVVLNIDVGRAAWRQELAVLLLWSAEEQAGASAQLLLNSLIAH